MNELFILENGLVPVYITDTGEKVVDGRELWQGLESRQEFSNWIKRRLNDCETVENTDYFSFDKKVVRENGASTRVEYTIKLATAKEMAMLERNEIGKQVRKYFIAIEERHRQQIIDISNLSPDLQMFKKIFDTVAANQLEQKRIQQQLEQTTEKVAAVESTLSIVKDTIIHRDDDWRRWLNTTFNNAVIASDTKDYQSFRSETYSLLESRARCNLGIRLQNLRRRLEESGATKTKLRETGKLDVIEADPHLKEIYTAIIKEFAIRYTA